MPKYPLYVDLLETAIAVEEVRLGHHTPTSLNEDDATNIRNAVKELIHLRNALNSLRATHHVCEDSWYSCPKAEGGCANENQGTECNCGADEINAKIDQALGGTTREDSPRPKADGNPEGS